LIAGMLVASRWNRGWSSALTNRTVIERDAHMSVGTILLIILILLLIGAFPTWPHSTNWGYYPSGGVGILLLIVIILLVTGRI
jgi:drug/metabolite transporter (DMT)-like permease